MGAEQSTPVDENEAGAAQQNAGTYPSALVVCGPSGVGKGTLIRRLMDGSEKFGFSCSHTTRNPRPGEQEGVDYHFTTKDQFEADIAAGKFLEHAKVHDNIYGTSVQSVAKVAKSGKTCILDIDVQGARQVRSAGLRAIFVFVAPPSMEQLEARLRGRGTESEEQVQKRLRNAAVEMASMDEPGLYDYILVNSNLEQAAEQLRAIGARALAAQVGPAPLETAPAADEGDKAAAGSNTTELEKEAAPPQANGQAQHPQQQAVEAAPATAPAAAAEPLAPASQQQQQRAAAIAAAAQEEEEAAAAEAAATAAAEAEAVAAAEEVAVGKPVYLRTYEQHAGRVAVVTAASSELGSALCRAMALAGLKVVALAKTREGLQRLQKELVLDAGVSAANFLPIVCDTTKEAEVVAVPRIVVKRWPDAGVDILVHLQDEPTPAASSGGASQQQQQQQQGEAGSAAAAAAAPSGPATLLEGSADMWRDMLLESVLSVCLCSREVVQDMVTRQSFGYVINVLRHGQSAGRPPVFQDALVGAARAAVERLTLGLHAEVSGRGLPVPVCSVVHDGSQVSTTAHVGERTVSFSKASSDAASDVLEAVAWCLIN